MPNQFINEIYTRAMSPYGFFLLPRQLIHLIPTNQTVNIEMCITVSVAVSAQKYDEKNSNSYNRLVVTLYISHLHVLCSFFTNDIMKSLAQWPNGYGYGDNKLIWLLYNGMVLPLSLFCLLYHMRVYALHSRLVGWLVNRSVTKMHVNNSIATKKGQQKKPELTNWPIR